MKIDLMQLEFIDLNLRKIVLIIEKRFGEKVITSLFRISDSGVHGTLPLRGLDFRCKNLNHGKEVAMFVNDKWFYDSERPLMKCCLCHNTGKGLHLHIQTHPNTKRR